MHETNTIVHEDYSKLKVVSRIINLGNNLNLFVVGSSSDTSFLDYLVNKILDYSIDRISKSNTYKDFSSTLEHINSVLKTWNNDSEGQKINMIVGVLNDSEFLFSNIGKSSCYLVKSNNVIEITDKKDKKKEFSFISNGDLEHNDIIVLSSKRLLNFLSESDFIDSYSKKIDKFNDSINGIIEGESIKKNMVITSFIHTSKQAEEVSNSKMDLAKNLLYRIGDSNIVKRIIAIYLILKERFMAKGKMLKTILFVLAMFVIIFLLYSIIGKNMDTSNNQQELVLNQETLDEAKASLVKASESIKNKDIFNLNINNAEGLVEELEKKNLFANDLELLKTEISQIKKTFNGIESFQESDEKKLIDLPDTTAIKIIGVDKKIYVVGKNTITGPIIEGQESKTFTFEQIGDDAFLDASAFGSSISIITEKGQVIVFTTDGNFNVSDVLGQDSWEKSSMIDAYNTNIYLISKEDNQIYKHQKSGQNFGKGTPYLKTQDQESIGTMLDIAIDGGFYILKQDLSFVKFFSNPYRLESLTLNQAPDNYNIEDESLPLKIKTNQDLQYVYMLLNNKIFIFQPSPGSFQATKSLTYVGQIEGSNFNIIDFYIKYDGEIIILNEGGVYKMNFEISDGKILLR